MRFRPHKMYPGALLAQECCSYQATTQLLMGMRGDFAVIVHSDRDCSNVLPKTGGEVYSDHDYKFFCTNMREDELVTGQGNAKLRRAIELVNEAYHPKLIVVLSTCPTVMIGDNIKNVARKAGKELGVSVVAELTNGLRPKSPAEIIDDCYLMLSRNAPLPTGDVSKRVNLVGVRLWPGEREEIEAALGAMGLALNVVLNEDSSLDDFLSVGNARFNVHPGPKLMLNFDEENAKRFGQSPIEIPLPFGTRATDHFYFAIGSAAGLSEQAIASALEPFRREVVELVSQTRARLHEEIKQRRGRGPRCAFNVGSGRSFDLRRLAQEEMGALPFFNELGFETRLFIQGPADEESRQRAAGILGELGVTLPFTIFPDPGLLAKHVAPGEFDVFFGVDSLAGQLSKINLPLLQKSPLGLGYGAMKENLRRLEEAITTPFYRHFAGTSVSLPVARASA